MVLKVSLSEDQEKIINAQAAAVGADLKKPVSVPDLVRLWIDLGCHLQTPGPAAGTVLDEKHGIVATGAPKTHSIAPSPLRPFPVQSDTPESAQQAADLAAARAGRAPILKPGQKKP